MGGCGLGLSHSVDEQVMGCCDNGGEPLGFINVGNSWVAEDVLASQEGPAPSSWSCLGWISLVLGPVMFSFHTNSEFLTISVYCLFSLSINSQISKFIQYMQNINIKLR
jgi:hypothetical protein